jgi:hypothetical protein
MSVEMVIEFTVSGVTSLVEAQRLADEHLHSLGVSDSGYGYTTVIELQPELMATNQAVPVTWTAAVTVRGRPR